MTHLHFFIPMDEAKMTPQPPQESSTASPMVVRPIRGVRAGCVHCGEIRVVWETGLVQVERPGHEPLDDHGNTSNT